MIVNNFFLTSKSGASRLGFRTSQLKMKCLYLMSDTLRLHHAQETCKSGMSNVCKAWFYSHSLRIIVFSCQMQMELHCSCASKIFCWRCTVAASWVIISHRCSNSASMQFFFNHKTLTLLSMFSFLIRKIIWRGVHKA